jgi:hypothetical protein
MVKGNSRQIIVVNAPDQKLFEQAIFILREGAVGADGITDEALLREAKQYISRPKGSRGERVLFPALWACGGAAATGLVWLLSLI